MRQSGMADLDDPSDRGGKPFPATALLSEHLTAGSRNARHIFARGLRCRHAMMANDEWWIEAGVVASSWDADPDGLRQRNRNGPR